MEYPDEEYNVKDLPSHEDGCNKQLPNGFWCTYHCHLDGHVVHIASTMGDGIREASLYLNKDML